MLSCRSSRVESPITGVPGRALAPSPLPILAPYIGLPDNVANNLRRATLPAAPNAEKETLEWQFMSLSSLSHRVATSLFLQSASLTRLGVVCFAGGSAIAGIAAVFSGTLAATVFISAVASSYFLMRESFQRSKQGIIASAVLLQKFFAVETELLKGLK